MIVIQSGETLSSLVAGLVGRHSKKLVTIVQFVIKAQNLVYVLKKSL